MATAIIEAVAGVSGLTLTLDLYPFGSDTALFTGQALTEAANQKGKYSLGYDMSAVSGLPSWFNATIKLGAAIFGTGIVYLTNDTTVHRIVSASALLGAQDATNTVATVANQEEMLTDLGTILNTPAPGSVSVDENYGGTNNLAYIDSSTGSGIDNANIQAFKASDWNSGRRTSTYVVARTTTNINGGWITPLLLDPGEYIVLAGRPSQPGQGGFGPDEMAVSVHF